MKRNLWSILLCLLLIFVLVTLTACDESAETPDDSASEIEGETIIDGDNAVTYDERGNLIRMEWLDENGNAEYSEVYEYNENDRCTAMFIYEDGALSYALRYEYDDYRCLCVKYYDETDTLMNIDEYIYDEDEMVCGVDSYFYMGDYCYHLIQYDAAMNMLYEEQYDESGEVTDWIRYEYENGLRVRGIEEDGYYSVYLHDEEDAEIGYQYYNPDGELVEEMYY